MKFTEKVISVLEPATNRAKAGNCSQVWNPMLLHPPIQGCYYKPTEGKTRRKKEGSRLWHNQNYTETVKAIFDEARRAGDVREAEINME